MNAHPSSEHLLRFADDDLAARERLETDEHVAACAKCRGIIESSHAVEHALATIPFDQPSASFTAAVLGRVLPGIAPSPARFFGFNALTAIGGAVVGALAFLLFSNSPAADVPRPTPYVDTVRFIVHGVDVALQSAFSATSTPLFSGVVIALLALAVLAAVDAVAAAAKR